jgi:hypothetical protein
MSSGEKYYEQSTKKEKTTRKGKHPCHMLSGCANSSGPSDGDPTQEKREHHGRQRRAQARNRFGVQFIHTSHCNFQKRINGVTWFCILVNVSDSRYNTIPMRMCVSLAT